MTLTTSTLSEVQKVTSTLQVISLDFEEGIYQCPSRATCRLQANNQVGQITIVSRQVSYAEFVG